MIRVKATREGLAGQKTSSGFVIDGVVPFVALPSTKALGKFISIKNPANGLHTFAIVLDVGPWNVDDHEYVFQPATQPAASVLGPKTVETRPQSESGVDHFGRATNEAGIDLGERIWHQLALPDNGEVEWEFIGG